VQRATRGSHILVQLESDVSENEELDAVSSPARQSSPFAPSLNEEMINYDLSKDIAEDEDKDAEYQPFKHPIKRASPRTNDEKALSTLKHMRDFPNFPLQNKYNCQCV